MTAPLQKKTSTDQHRNAPTDRTGTTRRHGASPARSARLNPLTSPDAVQIGAANAHRAWGVRHPRDVRYVRYVRHLWRCSACTRGAGAVVLCSVRRAGRQTQKRRKKKDCVRHARIPSHAPTPVTRVHTHIRTHLCTHTTLTSAPIHSTPYNTTHSTTHNTTPYITTHTTHTTHNTLVLPHETIPKHHLPAAGDGCCGWRPCHARHGTRYGTRHGHERRRQKERAQNTARPHATVRTCARHGTGRRAGAVLFPRPRWRCCC